VILMLDTPASAHCVFGVWKGEARFQALLPAAGIILVVVSAEVSMMTSFALRRVHRTCNAT